MPPPLLIGLTSPTFDPQNMAMAERVRGMGKAFGQKGSNAAVLADAGALRNREALPKRGTSRNAALPKGQHPRRAIRGKCGTFQQEASP
jgi:hypothetical protein